MRAEFVRELERGTTILAINLLKREQTKLKLLGHDDFVLSKGIELPEIRTEINVQSPAPVKKKRRTSSSTFRRSDSSPTLPKTEIRRLPPSRTNIETNIATKPTDSKSDDIQQLAKLILDGKMEDATKFIKSKDTSYEISSFDGKTNQYGQYHGFGKLIFKNGDIYEGNFVLVIFFFIFSFDFLFFFLS